jgi:hypothetical protein
MRVLGTKRIACARDVRLYIARERPYVVALLAKHIPASDLHMISAINALKEVERLIHSYFEEISVSTKQGRKL